MQVKKQFKWFTIFEYEKEQDYLREMHRSGWKFVRAAGRNYLIASFVGGVLVMYLVIFWMFFTKYMQYKRHRK